LADPSRKREGADGEREAEYRREIQGTAFPNGTGGG
jgi:hypothetical protein